MSAPDAVAALLSPALEGFRFATAEELEASRLETARAEIARDARTLRGALDPSVSAADFARLVRDQRLHALTSRYEVERGSVLVLGPAGAGKTLSLKRVGRRLLGAAWRAGDVDAPIVGALWTSAIEIATALRNTRLGSACALVHSAKRAPLLFLDELGQETHDPRWLLELLDFRYAPKHRPTLTTTGLKHGQLLERYGAGAVRRLTEPRGTAIDLHGGGQ